VGHGKNMAVFLKSHSESHRVMDALGSQSLLRHCESEGLCGWSEEVPSELLCGS
jgi:hypothetical protein